MISEVRLEVLTGNDDGARLRRLVLTALAADPDAFLSTAETASAVALEVWQARLSRPAEQWLVAVAADQDSAIANIGPADGSSDMEIHSVWVSASLRGQGVARRLVTALTGFAKEKHAPGVRLWVADANVSAVALYESLGFAPTGRTGAVKHPAHERRLDLSPHDSASAQTRTP